MAYALEDEFGDIIGKARRGQDLSQAKSQLLRVLQRQNSLVWNSIP